MIVGVGHDLVHVPRIARMLARWGRRFLDRVFSRAEQRYCLAFAEPAAHFAARFAAKEALYKAVSRGRRVRLGFRDAQVVHEEGVTLALKLSPRGRALLARTGATDVHVTLSHDGEYASAVVMIEAR
ncbi:MAG: holo-ACP synthase [Myxococcota bacterium]